MHNASDAQVESTAVNNLEFTQRIDIGNNLYVQSYVGHDLQVLLDNKKVEIANCYRDVFNESWGEEWTTKSALEEITKVLDSGTSRNPIAAFLFYKNTIVGFTLGSVIHRENLSINDDMPFELSHTQKAEGCTVAQYWLTQVLDKELVFLWPHTGVLKTYRKKTLYFLALPLFQYALQRGCNVVLLWTSLSSSGFKLALSIGLYPIHFFITDNLTLISGNIKNVLALFEKTVIEKESTRTYKSAIKKIDHYLCK